MANLNYTTTIAIDTNLSVFHFYSMVGNNTAAIVHNIKHYTATTFDEDFFKKFKEAVKEFTQNTPSDSIRKVTVILPDSAVLTDTIKVPTMKGFGQTKKMLEVTLRSLYRNYQDLHIISNIADQNKEYTTFSIAAVQEQIVNGVYAACAENKLLVDTLTYASSATVCGATVLDSSLKNKTYLFLDIKETYSRFVFVANGKTIGSYTLPFGLAFLRKPKVTQEDMLFDHSYAELTVLNAKERARSKKLTVMALGEETVDEAAEADEDEELLTDEELAAKEEIQDDDYGLEEGELEEEQEEQVVVAAQPSAKVFSRKSPRKLPKFMQREIPEDDEGIAYENFRVFIKWALSLINENNELVELGKPENVYVNLFDDFVNVFDRTNAEMEENGIQFTKLSPDKDEAKILANLELYGGLFPKQIASTCKL